MEGSVHCAGSKEIGAENASLRAQVEERDEVLL